MASVILYLLAIGRINNSRSDSRRGIYHTILGLEVIGGAMTSSLSVPNDPIFFLHHSSVNQILEKWLRKFNKNASVLSSYDAPIGHNRDDVIMPLFPVYTHRNIFKKSLEFGYEYEDVDEEGMCFHNSVFLT